MTDNAYDVVIIGSGMAGASIAYHLASNVSVLLLEAESAPGYHATGRSAALYAPSYGPPAIRALTRASGPFFWSPPRNFAASDLLHDRGALFVGSSEQEQELRAFYAQEKQESESVVWLDTDAACELVPVLRPECVAGAILDPRSYDIEVDLLLQGFLRGAREHGADLVKDARVTRLQREAGRWLVGCENGREFAARRVVNAAGAWVDQIATAAGLPGIGIEPRRRSAFLFEAPAGVDSAGWPLLIGIDESWYMKPDAGLLLGSPANTDLVEPHDVVAEDMDIMLAAHRIEENTVLEISRPRSTWAGLRSFVADGEPVLGFDPLTEDFFWAAALGGYGIQSAPAVGRLCAALLTGEPVPTDIVEQGLDCSTISPARLARRI